MSMLRENWNEYTAWQWEVQQPITQERMNNIEEGILGAYGNNDINATNIDTLDGRLNSLNSDVDGIRQSVQNLVASNQSSTTQLAHGEQAWVYVKETLIYKDNTEQTVSKTLADRLNEMIGNISTADGKGQSALNEINEVKSYKSSAQSLKAIAEDYDSQIGGILSQIRDATTAVGHDYLQAHFLFNESQISSLITRMGLVEDNLDGAKIENKYANLKQRFEAIEGILTAALDSTAKNDTFASVDERFEAIESELVEARGNNNNNLSVRLNKIDDANTNGSIIRRIMDDEAVIDDHQSRITLMRGDIDNSILPPLRSLQADILNRVHKTTDVANNLTTDTAGTKVLDAYMGYYLNQHKVSYDDIVNGTGTAANVENKVLDARVGGVLQNQIDAIQSSLQNGIAGQIAAIEAEIGLPTEGNSRIDTIESTANGVNTEVVNARTSTTYSATYNTLTDRLETDEALIAGHTTSLINFGSSIESNAAMIDILVDILEIEDALDENEEPIKVSARLDTLESTIQSINQATGNIGQMGTRIDGLESRMNALDNIETGKIKLLEDADTTLDGRLDTLEATVNTPTTGLSAKVSALETSINDASTGLAATKAIADAAKAVTDTVASTYATQSTVTTLAGRVTNLEQEPKSATTIIPSTQITYAEETGLPTLYTDSNKTTAITPTETVDYLLEGEDGKYYYWKYIVAEDPHWQKISGGVSGNGGGNNSGYDISATDYDDDNFEPAENTDYYVERADGVHHYRWVLQESDDPNEEPELIEVEIGTPVDKTQIKRYNVRIDSETTKDQNNQDVTQYYLYFYEFGYGEDSEINDQTTELSQQQQEYLALHLIRKLPMPSGGGGYAPTQAMKFTPLSSTAFKTPKESDEPILVKFFFTTGEPNEGAYYDILVDDYIVSANNQMTSGNPEDKQYTWPEGNNIPVGFYSIDVTSYLANVKTDVIHDVRISARHANNESLTAYISYKIEPINFKLTSNAEEGLIVSTEDTVTIPYIPFGNVDKTVHVVIDNDTEHESTFAIGTVQGSETSVTIPAQEHGLHKIDLYMTAVADNKTIRTAHVYREYIWYNPADTSEPIIVASPYNGQTLNIDAYTELTIPYSIYHKDAGDYQIEYYLNYGTANENMFNIETASGNVRSQFVYIPTVAQKAVETQTITIKVDDVMAQFTMRVNPIDADIDPIPGALIDFDPSLYTNNSLTREPVWKTSTTAYDSYPEWVSNAQYIEESSYVIHDGYAYQCRETCKDVDWTPSHWTELGAKEYTFKTSPNFNWSNDISGGGYKSDEDGKCFIIKAGSYVDINYKMFKAASGRSAVYDTGMEMKIIFKTMAVRNVDAVWFSNVKTISNKPIGIQLEAHKGWLKTDKASNANVNAESNNYTAWVENTVYDPGTLVLIKDTIYKCLVHHTSVEASLKKTDEDAWDDYLKVNWLKIGIIETSIDSTNTYLYFPYSEEDKIELDINVNRYSVGNNFIMSYEDGVPSKAYPYNPNAGGDGLYHIVGDEGTIRIGSPDCDVYIYKLRIYNKSLTTNEILQNFIADGQTVQEKLARYNRNCIYWDGSKYLTKKSLTAVLDPIKLAERMPDVKILMLDAPTFTLNKKSYIKYSNLRCLQAEGGKVYPATDADNWYFMNGYHAGQGTTSDNYGQSGRNVDFLFECDGTLFPANKKDLTDFETGYQSSVLKGNAATKWDEATQTWVPTSIYDDVNKEWVPNSEYLTQTEIQNWTPHIPEACTSWKGDDCKISLTHDAKTGADTSVPNNYFNLKVNIASSENVNNALFAKRYNDFLPYISPAKARNAAIKNCMEFVPAVLFIRENDTTQDQQGNYINHSEFNDTEWHFYALGNIGDSKKTDYTRAYDPDDINEFTLEFSDNNTNNGQFQSGVFIENGIRKIETPYPAWSNTAAYAQGDRVAKDGSIYELAIEEIAAPETGNTNTWTAANWTKVKFYPDYAINTTYSIGDRVYYNNNLYENIEAVTDEEDIWAAAKWQQITEPYLSSITAINPMEYIYPITPAEWNIPDSSSTSGYLNNRHHTLLTEKFDGDHSFEFRYACKGDYRDGKLINDTTGHGDAQGVINHDAFIAFYEWVITSTKQEFQNELREWCVPSAMEFYYAYTHYYTMMDNRAKNSFWHMAKTGEYHRITHPKKAMLHVYEEADGEVTVDNNGVVTGTFIPTEDTEIVPGKAYYCQYAYDLVVYDMDTAAGIDNNGALVFPYGKEDRDYRTEGDAVSGYAFNGAGSIFWRRLSDPSDDGGFEDAIRDIMNNVNINCFNSQNLIDEFDAFQACFPEEVWRLDIERKYIRTFTGNSYDGSITYGKQNSRFLQSMMQGRKKYQRRQWIRNQGVYFNSKYRLSDNIANSNTVSFRTTTPSNDGTLAVLPDYHLKLTPYQDMYLNVQVGNGGFQTPIRAKAGTEYTFDLTSSYQDTVIAIHGSNYLSNINNLAPMYPYAIDMGAIQHLKHFNMGTDEIDYVNTKLGEAGNELHLSTNIPLLESINIKNCHSLSIGLDLSNGNNLKTIEAAGSSISGVTLPQYTNIEILHLPATVNSLSLLSARNLQDVSIINISTGENDFSRLTTLNIVDSDYNPDINWIDIAEEMLANAQDVTIYDLQGTEIPEIQTLAAFEAAKKRLEGQGGSVRLSGEVKIAQNGAWSSIEKTLYENTWNDPALTIDVSEGREVMKYLVTFKYDDFITEEGDLIPGRELAHLYLENNAAIPDIYQDGTLGIMPSRDRTVRNTYQFGTRVSNQYVPYSGWKIEGSTQPLSSYTNSTRPRVTRTLTIVTNFVATVRRYNVNWYLSRGDVSPIVTVGNIEYGGGQNLHAPTVKEIHELGGNTYKNLNVSSSSATYDIFMGWDKLPINITPGVNDSAYNIYGVWHSKNIPLNELFNRNAGDELTIEQLFVLSRMDNDARKIVTNNVTDVGECSRMTCTMGRLGPSDGTVIIGPAEIENGTDIPPLRTDSILFNEESNGITNIKPYQGTDNSFTIAIDYCFSKEAYGPEAQQSGTAYFDVLASCYYSQNTSTEQGSATTVGGFALFYLWDGGFGDKAQAGPRFGFGDMFKLANVAQSIPIGTSATVGDRNVIVIRHEKNSSVLHIYSGFGFGATSLPTEVAYQTISWNDLAPDVRLRFGYITDNFDKDDTNYTWVRNNTDVGKGTIYWAKYWDYDIGDGECRDIANWPHEEITFAISKMEGGVTNGVNSAMQLTALEASTHGRVIQSSVSTLESYGWGLTDNGAGSIVRDICNTRIFNGLPIMLQSVLFKETVRFLPTITTAGSYGSIYTLDNSYLTSQDYIYIPTIANMASMGEKPYIDWYKEDPDIGNTCNIYSWINASNMIVYNNYNQGRWNVETNSDNIVYANLRFPYIPLDISHVRIFRGNTTAFDSGSSVTHIAEAIAYSNTGLTLPNESGTFSLRVGDIFIPYNNDTAYIYLTEDIIEKYGIQHVSNTNDSDTFYVPTDINAVGGGAWVEASEYWTRSMIGGQQSTNYSYLTKFGAGYTSSPNTRNGINLVYSFSI